MPTINKNWIVYTLLDERGATRYVARGRPTRGVPPWTQDWDARLKNDSPLAHWLRGFKECPAHKVLHSGLSAIAAEELLIAERKRLSSEDQPILGNRNRDTYRHGGGLCKVVFDDKGDLHESLTIAARVHGIALSTAAKRIMKGLWRYVPK